MLIKVVVLYFFLFNSFAAVWKSNRLWSVEDLSLFQKWVFEEVRSDIFSSKQSHYYGIETDCADVIVTLMAIYSKKNHLELTFYKNDSILSSDTIDFDYIVNDELRFYKYVKLLNNLLSTIDIAQGNSISIDPREIKSGDIYVVEWKNVKLNRHLYLIKDILPSGDFELFSSTTPQKVRTLSVRRGMPLHKISRRPWGFKRVLPANLMNKLNNMKSDYQYQLLKSNKPFFKTIKSLLTVEDDSFNKSLKRRIFNVCDMFLNRDEEILNTINVLQARGTCLEGDLYELHSTFQRDSNLKRELNRLLNGWLKIREMDVEIDPNIKHALDYIVRKEQSRGEKEALNLCSIIVLNKEYGLRDLTYAIVNKRMSSNPNVTRASRWGLEKPILDCE